MNGSRHLVSAAPVGAYARVGARAGEEERAVAPLEVLVAQDAAQEEGACRAERLDCERPLDAMAEGDAVEEAVHSRDVSCWDHLGDSFGPVGFVLLVSQIPRRRIRTGGTM